MTSEADRGDEDVRNSIICQLNFRLTADDARDDVNVARIGSVAWIFPFICQFIRVCCGLLKPVYNGLHVDPQLDYDSALSSALYGWINEKEEIMRE